MGSQFTSNNGVPAAKADPPRKTSFLSKLMIEPVLAGPMMAIFLGQTSLQNLYLKTACSVDLHFPESICEQGVGEAFREAEVASQKLVSEINVSRGFVGAFISTLVLLFLGPWSDCSRRRKPLIVVSLLGMCLTTLNVLVIIAFPVFSSAWVLYMVQIPMSLGGNFGLLLAAGFSYIGDVCHASGLDVTMTMGKHRAYIQVSTVLGSVLGPLLYRYVGFFGVFPIVFFLQLSALLYAIFHTRDVRVNLENRVSVLDIRLPLDAARCLVKPRERHKRTVVLMMLVVALAERTVMAAEVVLLYMFVRNQFRWDDIWFGSYLAYRHIVSFVGTLIILRVFKSRLKLSNETIGVLSGFSMILSQLAFMSAQTTAVVFIVPAIAVLAQGAQVVRRPIVNNQIQTNEQGKIYSVVSALEQAWQMAVAPSYSFLYSRTADTFPHAWLIPCAAIACIFTMAFAIARKLSEKQAAEAIAPDDPDGNEGNDDKGLLKEKFRINKNDTKDDEIQEFIIKEKGDDRIEEFIVKDKEEYEVKECIVKGKKETKLIYKQDEEDVDETDEKHIFLDVIPKSNNEAIDYKEAGLNNGNVNDIEKNPLFTAKEDVSNSQPLNMKFAFKDELIIARNVNTVQNTTVEDSRHT